MVLERFLERREIGGDHYHVLWYGRVMIRPKNWPFETTKVS